MSDVVFTNVRILDGTGQNPYTGSVLVQGNRIRQVGRSTAPIAPGNATVIDGAGATLMPGMVELGEDIFLKPVRRGIPKYASSLADMVAQPRAATVMGLLEESRTARQRGFKVAQKNGSMKTAFGQVKDWFVGNF